MRPADLKAFAIEADTDLDRTDHESTLVKCSFVRQKLEELCPTDRESPDAIVASCYELRTRAHIAMRTGHLDDAEDMLFNALNACSRIIDSTMITTITSDLGNLFRRKHDYARSLEYLYLALDQEEARQRPHVLGALYSNIGATNLQMGDLQSALSAMQNGLRCIDESRSSALQAALIGNIGAVHYDLGEYEDAARELAKAVELYRQANNSTGVAVNTLNLGSVMVKQSRFSDAVHHFQSAFDLYASVDDPDGMVLAMQNMGLAYLEAKDFEPSLQCLTHALEIARSIPDEMQIALTSMNLAQLLCIEPASGDSLNQSESLLLNSLQTLTEVDSKRYLTECHGCLADLYKLRRDWEKVVFHIEARHQILATIVDEDVKLQSQRLLVERTRAEAESEKRALTLLYDQKRSELQRHIQMSVRTNLLLDAITARLSKHQNDAKSLPYESIADVIGLITEHHRSVNERGHLLSEIEEVHEQFFKRLQMAAPTLTRSERHVAALLRMSMTTTNIAAALFISQRTVEHHRNHIRKKLGLAPSDDLIAFVSDL